ncbi:MAG: phosphotransferase [Candidatus Kerfeldbacteria bacterium]|nr:phosphotransferase [Candidatus Kerfeldbacteria bacterium]
MKPDADRFQRDLIKHLRRRWPRGSHLESVTAAAAGTFLFKHALRVTLAYRTPDGQSKRLVVHANIPSRDTRHEATVADRLQRALWGSGRFSGRFKSPQPLGLISDKQSNLYADVPGEPLLSLLRRRSPLAIITAKRTAEWLGQLYQLRLKIGPRRDVSRIAKEAGLFHDNIVRVAPALAEQASLILSSALAAQVNVLKKHRAHFRTIHGDLNLGNSIAGRNYTALIDFGNSLVFDPASDAGNFLAQIDILAWQKKLSPRQARALQANFLRSFKNIPGLGNKLDQRIELHRAWWVLQICSYVCATNPRLGRRIAAVAIRQAGRGLTGAGFPVRPALASTARAAYSNALMDADVMLAYFRQYHRQFFPGSTSVQAVHVHHQSALSTTSFLMRYTLTLTDRAGRPMTRIVRGNRVQPETVRFLRHVGRLASGFSTMRLLAFRPTDKYFFYEELAGRPLRTVSLTSPSFDRAVSSIGTGLANFHRLPTGNLRPLSLRAETQLRRQHLTHLRRFGRGCLPEVAEVSRRLSRAERAIWGQEHRLVHNDFQASNVLLTATGIGIIDFTMSGVGHPAIDVANFLAHLEVMLYRHRPTTDIRRLRRAFLSAYARRRRGAKGHDFRRAVTVFELRSALDILAITVVNLGPQDPNRKKYVDLLVSRIRSLVQSIT